MNAPFSWPKNSLPDSDGTTVLQSSTTSRFLLRPRVELVDELSDPLLPGAALAGDQHRGVGEPRDLDGVPEHRLPGGAVADQEVLDVAALDAARRSSASGAAAPRPAVPSPPGRTS